MINEENPPTRPIPCRTGKGLSSFLSLPPDKLVWQVIDDKWVKQDGYNVHDGRGGGLEEIQIQIVEIIFCRAYLTIMIRILTGYSSQPV
jgi:hypothetical protein